MRVIPKLFDSHTHFNFNAFKDDWQEAIKRSLDAGVWFINVGAESKTSKRALEISLKYEEGVYASVGLHPIHTYNDELEETIKGETVKFITKAEDYDEKFYTSLLENNDKIKAIGEIGLDYFHIKKFPEILNSELKEKQKKVFSEQLDLAIKFQKPVILHCRPDKSYDAYWELLKILDTKDSLLPNPGIIHCFLGNTELLNEFLKRGFYIGFNGIITFVPDYSELVKQTPLDRIVLETDSPWLAPVPYRGKRNESLYVAEVAKKIAEIKEENLSEVKKITTENALKVFNIKN